MSIVHDDESVGPLGADRPETIAAAIEQNAVPIAVYGLGKVGIPMAAVLAERTGRVIGVDIDSETVDTIASGAVPFDHEPGLAVLVESMVEKGSLVATTEGAEAAREARVHIVIVPVGVDEAQRTLDHPKWTPEGRAVMDAPRPDLSALEQVTETIAAGATGGDLVVIESTVPVGTTDSLVATTISEMADDSDSIGVAFSPERVSSGRALTDLRGAYPKVVGGIDDESTTAATWVYRSLTDAKVIPVSDAATAEAIKLFEGAYRDVNIALANELARSTDDLGIDVREAIAAANTQPYCDIHDPGAGVGGHCIPVYPHLLRSSLDLELPLVQTARQTNDRMPMYVVELVVDELAGRTDNLASSTVGIFGLTYRAGIPETSNAPAQSVIESLRELDISVLGIDPTLEARTVFGVPCCSPAQVRLSDLDVAVLMFEHEAITDQDWDSFDGIVIDCADALDGAATYTIGRGRG